MIKLIAAIDSKQGLATDKGIPWDIPVDRQYYRDKTEGSDILIGYRTYLEFSRPMPNRRNYVLTRDDSPLKAGFVPVTDLAKFLSENPDAWVIGGAGLFSQTIDKAGELYLTHIQGDFHCTKFFPEYKESFELADKTKKQTQNGLRFYFARYVRKVAESKEPKPNKEPQVPKPRRRRR